MAQLTKSELISRLLAYKNDSSPYKVTANGDVVTIELDLADAKWYTIFQKNGLKESYKIIITLDDAKKQAQVATETYSVEWSAGVPKLGARMSIQKGKQIGFKFGAEAGIKEDGSIGQAYKYSLNSFEILSQIKKIITDAGWKQAMSGNQKGGVIVGIITLVLLIVAFGIAIATGSLKSSSSSTYTPNSYDSSRVGY